MPSTRIAATGSSSSAGRQNGDRAVWETEARWSGGVRGDEPERLPSWVTWQQRPFPDANLLFLPGRNPALIDSGFVGHAAQTADWVRTRTGQLALVVNTHWHADHVGGNGILQARGAGIAASVPDADAVARRS
jgi:glyoxylase-like metal-dependent hydrolase (beta-lactamase superfamily II)